MAAKSHNRDGLPAAPIAGEATADLDFGE